MNKVAILTNSYRPDFERFVRLHRSVVRHADQSMMHHVIVPARDVARFRGIESTRLTVWKESDFLPGGIVATDSFAAAMASMPWLPSTLRCSAVNLRRPWPPIRGWVLQQILKLSAATALAVDAVVIIDSDVVLARPLKAETFLNDGIVRLYELPGGVTPDMVRHVEWTQAAHRMLGLPAPEGAEMHDYVAGVISWDPVVVKGCLARIERVTGMSWATAFGSQLHVSEFILYGTYLRHFGTSAQRSFSEQTTLCHSYWKPEAMKPSDVLPFVDGFGSNDLAVHVQSNSKTDNVLVERIVDGIAARH